MAAQAPAIKPPDLLPAIVGEMYKPPDQSVTAISSHHLQFGEKDDHNTITYRDAWSFLNIIFSQRKFSALGRSKLGEKTLPDDDSTAAHEHGYKMVLGGSEQKNNFQN